MLEELCKHRKLKDIEFFINRRDFPLLNKYGYEPYYNIWDSHTKPLVSHNYDKYIPILSMSKTEAFADVLIPSYEDWIRVSGKTFINSSYIDYSNNLNSNIDDWSEKKGIAVFRGGSTGCGVTIDTNTRLKIAFMSHNRLIDKDDGLPFLDAGITNWNLRARKIIGNPYLQTIDKDKLPFKLVPKLSYKEQSTYKYIIHIEGHVSAHRLACELGMNSVILLVESEWKSWISKFLVPFKHYIPISSDLTDIYEKIKWCKNNDVECKKIAKNCLDFYNTYLTKDAILDYMQKLLIDIKADTGTYLYNSVKPLDFVMQIEEELIEVKEVKELDDKILNTFLIPCFKKRNYHTLNGIKMFLSDKKLYNHFDKLLQTENASIIFKNKFGLIHRLNYSDYQFVIKSSRDVNKIKEYIHEAFVGKIVLNNLLKYIPNFNFIFDIYTSIDIDCEDSESYNIITEYNNGKTFQDYINSVEFNFSNYLSIILQLCLALDTAQKTCFFVHNDLTPWNIILKRSIDGSDTLISYVINGENDIGDVINFKSNLIPVIIDYGKSHVVYNDEHHGFVNMFNFIPSHDIITLLITSVYEILNSRYCTNYDSNCCLKLINFLSDSEYRKQPFTIVKETMQFLKKEKKYINLVLPKKGLETKTSIDLFKYITKEFRYKFNFEIVTNFNCVNTGDSIQIYNFLNSTSDEERIKSYIDILEEDVRSVREKPKNILEAHRISQQKEKRVMSIFSELENFLKSVSIELKPSYKKLYKKALRDIYDLQTEMIDSIRLTSIDLGILSPVISLPEITYVDTIFSTPKKVLEILENFSIYASECDEGVYNLFDYFEMKIALLDLKARDKKYFSKYFRNDNVRSVISILNNFYNYTSLIRTSKYIYDNNLSLIKGKEGKEGFENIQDEIRLYKEILKNSL